MIESFLFLYIFIYGVNYGCLLRKLPPPLTRKQGIYHLLLVSFIYIPCLATVSRNPGAHREGRNEEHERRGITEPASRESLADVQRQRCGQ